MEPYGSRVGAVRLRLARLRRSRHRRLGRQVRARRARGGAGRAGCSSPGSPRERRLGHPDRSLRPLARRRGGLERSRRRSSVQGDRAGDHVDGSRRGFQSERRAEDRRDRRARRGRSVLPVGSLAQAGAARPGRRRRDCGGQERGGGPLLAADAPLAHRSDAAAAGTTRLSLRHRPSDRRVQAARRPEAACTSATSATPPPRTRRPNRRPISPRPSAGSCITSPAARTSSAAVSNSRTIPGTGRRASTRVFRPRGTRA